MAVSKTSICNNALTHLGERQIASVDDDNQRARVCKLRFDDVLKLVLGAHPWTCATKRAELGKFDAVPVWGFSNMFELPADFLRILQIEDQTRAYRLEVDATNGLVLVTDSATANIRYIHDVSDFSVLTHEVANLVGLRLASEVAEPLTSKTALKEAIEKRFLVELAVARSLDSMQGTPEVIEDYSWINARKKDSRPLVVFDVPAALNPTPVWGS